MKRMGRSHGMTTGAKAGAQASRKIIVYIATSVDGYIARCMVTVPALPAATAERRKSSGAIQRRMLPKSRGVASSYRRSESAGWKPKTTVLFLPARATITGPSCTCPIFTSSGAASKMYVEGRRKSLVRKPAHRG